MRRLLLVVALGWSGNSIAGTCSVLTPTTGNALMDFGVYTALGGNVDDTALLTLVCVPNLPLELSVAYSVAIDAGTGSGGSFDPRRMTAGAYGLNYNLYRDASRTLIWGDGTAGAARQTGTCAATCVLTVYGRLFGGQGVPAASYSDAVVLTLEF